MTLKGLEKWNGVLDIFLPS